MSIHKNLDSEIMFSKQLKKFNNKTIKGNNTQKADYLLLSEWNSNKNVCKNIFELSAAEYILSYNIVNSNYSLRIMFSTLSLES